MSTIRTLLFRFLSWLRLVMTIPVQPNTERIKTLHCEKKEIKYIGCSNAIYRLENLNGYFCECRKHSSEREYVKSLVRNYFSVIRGDDEHAADDMTVVLTALSNPHNLKKFMAMGENRVGAKSACAEVIRTGDASLVGIEGDFTDTAWVRRIRRFIGRYAWCEVFAYRLNRFNRRNQYQVRIASRVLGTYAVAKLLGLHHIVPPVEYVNLIIDDLDETKQIPRLGTFMKAADGICAMDIPHMTRRSRITPQFQNALLTLNLLDAICHEGDHSPNNYNVVPDDDGMIVGVSAFDNNGISTFTVKSDVDFESFKGCSPFVKNGCINRPCLDRALADRVLRITKKQLKENLSDYLNIIQINSTWKRIIKIKKAIRKTLAENPDFLRASRDFTYRTIEEELSGKYGKTYLLSFLNDCKVRDQYKY